MQIEVGGLQRPPIELAALFLVFLRRSAEVFLERPVPSGVITVPVCFSPFERQTLRLAARMAGFQAVRLIDEPTAVALAWVAGGGKGRAAICCWGAGYLSASIVEAKDRFLHILATGGMPAAGGDVIDLQLAGDFLERVRGKVGKLQNEAHVARYILTAAEAAKRDLAVRGKAELHLQIAGRSELLQQAYSSKDLDVWMEPLKAKAEQLCERILADSGLLKGDLDALIIAGGMTHIGALSTHLQEIFERRPVEGLDPEDAAVLGALARARLLDRERSDFLVFDALSQGLGLEEQAGSVSPALERGIFLPAGKREVFTTYLERQTEVAIQLFGQGMDGWEPLAQVEISKIPPMKAGLPVLEVFFMVDEDGVLDVKASETSRDKLLGLEVRPLRGLASSTVQTAIDGLPEAKEGSFEGELRDELRQRGRFILDALRELTDRRAGIMTRDEKQLIAKKSRELDEVLEGADFMEMRSCAQELEEAARPLVQRDVDASLQSLLR